MAGDTLGHINDLEACLKLYQQWRVSIIPIAQKSKKPLVDWKEYQKRKPDVAEIAEWWEKHWSKQANVGVVCGKVSNKLVVLDFDDPGQQWEDFLITVQERYGKSIYELTPVVATNRGFHVYFRTNSPTKSQKPDGVEIRGDGNYVVAPPSVHPDGAVYQFINQDVAEMLQIGDLSEMGVCAITCSVAKCEPASVSKVLEGVAQGSRNDSAFKMATTLRDVGSTPERCKDLLLAWNEQNSPPLSIRELETTITSAYTNERGLAGSVREFINNTQGGFSVTQLDNELGITGRSKGNRKQILWRLAEEGLIERVKTGQYRVREACLPDMDWQYADTGSGLDIKLPFDIHSLVEIYPKNIFVIAGTTNAGKTAYLFNFIKLNMHRWEIHYFTSELSEQELRKRLSKFGDGIDWRFHPHERNSNFDSVIVPGAINIIDYLEPPSGEYYAIADQISAIHSRLTTGIAFIAIQKKRKAELGRGAEFSEERARLYLSMDSGRLKIVKAKNWLTDVNPNGVLYTFKLVEGCKFVDVVQKEG